MTVKKRHHCSWDVKGDAPTTMTSGAEGLRVVWKKGKAWSLRHVGEGNKPWALPGKEVCFDKAKLEESVRASRAIIVVGAPHGGLTSFYHWLTRGDGSITALPVDLREAQLRGNDVSDRMKAIAHGLRVEVEHHRKKRQIETDLVAHAEPIDMIEEIAARAKELKLDALVFRGFEALEEEEAKRFFGRLRALLEHPRQPLKSLGLVLLGQSVGALDPQDQLPVSALLSLSDLYTPAGLSGELIAAMAERIDLDLDAGQLHDLVEWSGGEPLLVQVLFQLLWPAGDKCETVGEAIELLERERLPAFDVWMRILARQMREKAATARVIERLLRRGSCPDDPDEPRFAFAELFIENWIRRGDDGKSWTWRSECRRMLAADAHAEKRFG